MSRLAIGTLVTAALPQASGGSTMRNGVVTGYTKREYHVDFPRDDGSIIFMTLPHSRLTPIAIRPFGAAIVRR